jgi:hypothetical protein
MPGDTGLTRVASDRTVARTPVATCARSLPRCVTVSSSIRDAQGDAGKGAGVTDRLGEMKDLVEMLAAFGIFCNGTVLTVVD